MRDDTTVGFSDPVPADELTELLRAGAQRLTREAVQTELEQFLAEHKGLRDT